MFSQHVGVCDSNEAGVLAILEALWVFLDSYQNKLIVESDSSNVVVCALNCNPRPWKFQLYFNEIRELSSRIDVVFCHGVRLGWML